MTVPLDQEGIGEVMGMQENENKTLLRGVCIALQEKGYNPIVQIVGYNLTEDTAYNYQPQRRTPDASED